MQLAEDAKSRSTCYVPKGAILVRDNRMISTGYNDTPTGILNCGEGGCERCAKRRINLIASGQDLDRCSCVHAEANSIIQAARYGVTILDSILYTTFTPCTDCAKMLINAGIKRVVAKEKYPNDLGVYLMRNAGVKLDLYG